ncbi:MAG: hypothetical protein K2R98_10400 [Gemmataceae bacterium]|nr:hypothetical protein [Gemmataceae bacterium]
MYHDIIVRPHPPGQYTANVWGIPDLSAIAPTEQEAIDKIKQLLASWLAQAKWVRVDVPAPHYVNPVLQVIGTNDPNDPMQREYLEELARMKREDFERTMREYEQECPGSSSTPTT